MSNDVVSGVGVDSRAQIHSQASIGPYCVIGPEVRIGRGTRLDGHVTLVGRVVIGEHNHLHSGVVVGSLSRRDGVAVLGNYNVLRESVNVHPSRPGEPCPTTIGDHNYLMACVNVGRGCQMTDHIIMANATRLASRVQIGRYAFLSGGVLVRSRVSIGAHAFVSMMSRIDRDVPPFMMIDGKPPRPRCVNLVGLKRHGFCGPAIRALVKAHRLIYRDRLGLSVSYPILEQAGMMTGPVGELFDFIQASDG